jgi:hypothetical protein
MLIMARRDALRVRTFSLENVRKGSELHQAFSLAVHQHQIQPADSAGENFPEEN